MSVMTEGGDTQKSKQSELDSVVAESKAAYGNRGQAPATAPSGPMDLTQGMGGGRGTAGNSDVLALIKAKMASDSKAELTYGIRVGAGDDQATRSYGQIDYYSARTQGLYQQNNPYVMDALRAASGNDPSKMDEIYAVAIELAAASQYSKGMNSGLSLVQAIPVAAKELREKESGGGGGGAYTNVSRNVTLTNEGTARRIIDNALTQYLGRRATPTENRAFLKALNMQERQNPTVSVTKGVASKGGNNSSTTTTGGFDATDFAERFSRSQEGYAEYQAATTYMDMFIKALTDQTRVI